MSGWSWLVSSIADGMGSGPRASSFNVSCPARIPDLSAPSTHCSPSLSVADEPAIGHPAHRVMHALL